LSSDRFDHLFIEPESFDETVSFFCEGLGWSRQFAWGGPGEPRGIGLTGGGITVVIAERHPADDHSKTHGINGTRPTVHMQVADLDARYAQLAAKGLTLFPPEKTHWGTRWFVVRDPNGNLFAYEEERKE